MKFNVNRESLVKALQKVGNAIGNRSTLPVLGNVLLEADANVLKLTTTDLDIRISTTVEAEIEVAGKTTVPVKKFAGLVNKFTDDVLYFDCNDRHHSELVCGNSKFKLLGLAPDDFPGMVEFTPVRRLTYKESDMRRICSQLSYAVSLDDSRKVLHGILCSSAEGQVAFVATDGKRLALVEKMPESFEGTEGESIIPLRAANEIKRLVDGDQIITIEIGDKQAAFITESLVLTTKLIEGIYPNYRQVIPKEFNCQVNVPTATFLSKIELVAQVLADSNGFIKVTFADNQLKLQAASAEIGEGVAIVDIEYTNEPVEVSFNPSFLIEPLRTSATDMVVINLNDAFSPVEMDSSNGFLYIIMPMRNNR